jgi:hypothetical protein
VPPTEVELGHCDEALDRVLNLGQREECLGVGHEAVGLSAWSWSRMLRKSSSHFVMRSSIDRGSRMKVGRVTRLRSAPGRSCEMMCESTVRERSVSQRSCCIQLFRVPGRRTAALLRVDDRLILLCDLLAVIPRSV